MFVSTAQTQYIPRIELPVYANSQTNSLGKLEESAGDQAWKVPSPSCPRGHQVQANMAVPSLEELCAVFPAGCFVPWKTQVCSFCKIRPSLMLKKLRTMLRLTGCNKLSCHSGSLLMQILGIFLWMRNFGLLGGIDDKEEEEERAAPPANGYFSSAPVRYSQILEAKSWHPNQHLCGAEITVFGVWLARAWKALSEGLPN